MSTAPIQPSPANEDATFIQHALPGLEDGTYELDVSVRIDDESGKPVNTAPLERSYQLAVTGDRFRLANPGATIASVFPASNAAGEFDTVLAHVVFNAQTFPWSRSPTAALPEEAAGGGHDADVPTWLAVLVLSDDDVAAFPAGELVLDPVTSILGNLFPPNAYPGSDLGTNCSYFDDATSTEHWLEVDEQASRSGPDDRHPARAVRRDRADPGRSQAQRPRAAGVGREQAAHGRRDGAQRSARHLLDRRRQPPAGARRDEPRVPRLARAAPRLPARHERRRHAHEPEGRHHEEAPARRPGALDVHHHRWDGDLRGRTRAPQRPVERGGRGEHEPAPLCGECGAR